VSFADPPLPAASAHGAFYRLCLSGKILRTALQRTDWQREDAVREATALCQFNANECFRYGIQDAVELARVVVRGDPIDEAELPTEVLAAIADYKEREELERKITGVSR